MLCTWDDLGVAVVDDDYDGSFLLFYSYKTKWGSWDWQLHSTVTTHPGPQLMMTSLMRQVLPPLRDVTNRPEVGSTVRNKLVRLMTHVDLGVKQIAAEFLFVLCKERGEWNSLCLTFYLLEEVWEFPVIVAFESTLPSWLLTCCHSGCADIRQW